MSKNTEVEKQEASVFLKCECSCSMLVVERSAWSDGNVHYNISVQDSRYDHNNTTLFGRIKGALKILFGKPVYYSDVFIDEPKRFGSFIRQLNELFEQDKDYKKHMSNTAKI